MYFLHPLGCKTLILGRKKNAHGPDFSGGD